MLPCVRMKHLFFPPAQILLGYYTIPRTAEDPLEMVVNPQGLEARNRVRTWLFTCTCSLVGVSVSLQGLEARNEVSSVALPLWNALRWYAACMLSMLQPGLHLATPLPAPLTAEAGVERGRLSLQAGHHGGGAPHEAPARAAEQRAGRGACRARCACCALWAC